MPETNGDAARKVVMITGGTGLVGEGIKEAVEKDPKVKEITEGEGAFCVYCTAATPPVRGVLGETENPTLRQPQYIHTM